MDSSAISDLSSPPVNPLLYAFDGSDWVGQGVILLLLVVFIWAWSIILEKVLTLREARQGTARMLERCRQSRWPLELTPRLGDCSGPLVPIYKAGMDTLVNLLRLDDRDFELCVRQRTLPRPLTDLELAAIRTAMEQVAGTQNAALERRLTLLGTFVSSSPLLGLFGAAWGVLAAFCALAGQESAGLAVLAPGIAGALLATLASLAVAIPAGAAFNLLARSLQLLGNDVEAFMDELLDGLRRPEP
ncbi:MAG: MotA/TolQ/ExbB proton channel family protein [Lentisphaeria bacterium]